MTAKYVRVSSPKLKLRRPTSEWLARRQADLAVMPPELRRIVTCAAALRPDQLAALGAACDIAFRDTAPNFGAALVRFAS